MSEAIIIAEPEYLKAQHIFERMKDFDCIAFQDDEQALAKSILDNNSRAVIVGVVPYKNQLYSALAKTGGGKGAIIARFGVGYDSIDLELAKQNNIIVTNVPDLGPCVAEHTIFMLGALIRNIAKLDREFRNGRFAPITGTELAGKTLVVAGLGRIGGRVAKIASFGFGMKVIAADIRKVDNIDELKRQYGLTDYVNDIDEVLPRADFISINMAASDATHHFFNADRLAKIKKGAFLVNTARGRLIDETALYDALATDHLAGAAIDVFETEPYQPINPDKDLRKLDNVVLTPHVSSNTIETNERMASSCLENIANFFAGRLDNLTRVV